MLKKFRDGHYLSVKCGEELPKVIRFWLGTLLKGKNQILEGGGGGALFAWTHLYRELYVLT